MLKKLSSKYRYPSDLVYIYFTFTLYKKLDFTAENAEFAEILH